MKLQRKHSIGSTVVESAVSSRCSSQNSNTTFMSWKIQKRFKKRFTHSLVYLKYKIILHQTDKMYTCLTEGVQL